MSPLPDEAIASCVARVAIFRGLDAPQREDIARFGRRVELASGVLPAFCAAASACAMKERSCWARVERMRPGRMRKSSSPLMAETPHIASSR